METTPQAQLAVLIDADNANAKRIDGLLAEVAKYGRATTKRAYGDWTNTHLGSWKQTLARHAIQPMQQFSNTRGKNSTDSALIIDAMDLLYTERFDGFCIVSSDSDFTRLASRIREAGLTVYGFGERKTPQPFVRACDRFIYVEVLGQTEGEDDAAAEPAVVAPPTGERRTIQNGRRPQPAPVAQQAAAARPAAPVADKPADAGNGGQGAGDRRPAVPRGAPLDDPALLNPLRAAVADACDDDGWAGLGAVGSLLSKRMPEFDPRNYGRKKLSDLFAAIAIFEVDERGEPGRSRALFVREKRDRDGGEIAVGARTEVAAAGDVATPSAAATTPVTAVEPKADGASQPPRPSAPQAASRPPQPPRPPQGGKPQQQGPRPPRPALQGLPAEPTDEELKALAGAGWAPRRDDRRPTWAVTPVPILPAAAAEPSPAAAPAAARPAEPVAAAPVVPVVAPVVQPAAEVAAKAPAEATPAAVPVAAATETAPRKAAARKPAVKKAAATKAVTKVSAEAATKVVTKAAAKAVTKAAAAASKAAPAPNVPDAPKRRSRTSKPASAD
jgi:uncharacterized LabA/DUF88 family protein